jgi:Holliday junction DNA helicase RuvB
LEDVRARVLAVAERLGDDVLRTVYERWRSYVENLRCERCGGSVRVEVHQGNGGWRAKAVCLSCGYEFTVFGLEGWELGVSPYMIPILLSHGILLQTYRSRQYRHYVLNPEVEPVLEEMLSGPGWTHVPQQPVSVGPPPDDLFDDIVGLEREKELLLRALRSNEPVHVLLVGPPASAKSMMLEMISQWYGVPILLGGTTTRAGLREFIYENRPEILLIDELDKIYDSRDLSVLLSWMESQRLTITMWNKRVTVTCPSVCKVIAAANTTKGIPPELLSRFLVVKIEPYKPNEVMEICVRIIPKRSRVRDAKVVEAIARVVVESGSRDPRDCVKLARLEPKSVEDVERISSLIFKKIGS